MSERKIRVAILGCGEITDQRHAPEYQANPKAEIMGFCDHHIENAQKMVDKYGGKVYESIEAVLADPEVEAVSVCTPNRYHAEHSIQALKAGKHVLCEKPMAMSLEEATAMREAELETGLKLMIGMNQRMVPAHIKAKELIASGMIGEIISVRTNFKHGGPETWTKKGPATWFFNKEEAGYGCIGDLGAHKFDLVRFLLNTEIKRTTATLLTLDKTYQDGTPIDVDDNAICIFETESGVYGTLHVSWTDYGLEDNSTIVYGKEGAIRLLYDEKYDLVVQMRTRTPRYLEAKQVRHLVSDAIHTDQEDNHTIMRYQMGAIATNDDQIPSGVIDAFIEEILGHDEGLADSKDGYNTQACIETAIASSKSGNWESVPHI